MEGVNSKVHDHGKSIFKCITYPYTMSFFSEIILNNLGTHNFPKSLCIMKQCICDMYGASR